MPAPTVEEKAPADSVTTVNPKAAAMKDANEATTELTAEAKAASPPVGTEAKPNSEAESSKPESVKKPDTAKDPDASNGASDSGLKKENDTKPDAETKPAEGEVAKVGNGDATKPSGPASEIPNAKEKTDTDAANGNVEKAERGDTGKTAEKTGDVSERATTVAMPELETKPETDGDAKANTGDGKKPTEKTPASKDGEVADSAGQNTDGSERKAQDVEEKGKVDKKMDDTAEPEGEEKKGPSANAERMTEEGSGASEDTTKPPKVRFSAVEERTMEEEEEEEYKPEEDENQEAGEEEEDEEEDEEGDEEGEIVEGDEPMPDLEGIPESVMTTLFENGGASGVLHARASKGDVEELRKLLGKGGEMEGKVDDRDVYQYTALHVAAENDKKEVCKLLLEHGADISAATKLHESKPLHYAAFEGHDEIIDLLLGKGADINSLTDDGRTPLYQAAMRGHDHCVELLLERGADRDLADKNGKKPSEVAGKKAVVDLFVAPPSKKARKE